MDLLLMHYIWVLVFAKFCCSLGGHYKYVYYENVFVMNVYSYWKYDGINSGRRIIDKYYVHMGEGKKENAPCNKMKEGCKKIINLLHTL